MDYKLTFIINNDKDNQDIDSTLKSIISNDEKNLKSIKIIIVSSDEIGYDVLEQINNYKEKYGIDITVKYYK